MSVLHKNICCGYSLESPRLSNEYAQHMFLWRNKQNYPQIPFLSVLLKFSSKRRKFTPHGTVLCFLQYGNCSKTANTNKRKNTLNCFSLLTSEAKGSNRFCQGRQFNCLPLQNWFLRSQNLMVFSKLRIY